MIRGAGRGLAPLGQEPGFLPVRVCLRVGVCVVCFSGVHSHSHTVGRWGRGVLTYGFLDGCFHVFDVGVGSEFDESAAVAGVALCGELPEQEAVEYGGPDVAAGRSSAWEMVAFPLAGAEADFCGAVYDVDHVVWCDWFWFGREAGERTQAGGVEVGEDDFADVLAVGFERDDVSDGFWRADVAVAVEVVAGLLFDVPGGAAGGLVVGLECAGVGAGVDAGESGEFDDPESEHGERPGYWQADVFADGEAGEGDAEGDECGPGCHLVEPGFGFVFGEQSGLVGPGARVEAGFEFGAGWRCGVVSFHGVRIGHGLH